MHLLHLYGCRYLAGLHLYGCRYLAGWLISLHGNNPSLPLISLQGNKPVVTRRYPYIFASLPPRRYSPTWPSLHIPSLARRYLIRALSLAVVSRRYLIRALSLPWPQLRTTKSAARYPVVSSQLVMTDSVVTRRYRLHRYRGPVVTRRYPYIFASLPPRRYSPTWPSLHIPSLARRYLIRALSLAVVSRRYLIRALSLHIPSLPLISPSLPLGSCSLHVLVPR